MSKSKNKILDRLKDIVINRSNWGTSRLKKRIKDSYEDDYYSGRHSPGITTMSNLVLKPFSNFTKYEIQLLIFWYDNYFGFENLTLDDLVELIDIFENQSSNYQKSVTGNIGIETHLFVAKLETFWDDSSRKLKYLRPDIPELLLSSMAIKQDDNAVSAPDKEPRYVDSQEYKDILQAFTSAQATLEKAANSMSELVPQIKKQYRPFGCYADVLKLIETKRFFPAYICGETGYGKTTAIEQSCAVAGREFIRTNITSETDKTTLLVVPQLVNGNLEYLDGPVLQAMKKGAILLLDEVDRGTEKLMCLQGILEGRPYYNERTGEMVHPAPGFNIFGTGNSKGQGGEAKYMVNILDDALLDRFLIMFIQCPPPPDVETEILFASLQEQNVKFKDELFIPTLIRWAERTRQKFTDEEVETAISTRRLLAICDAFVVFKHKKRALDLCLNRMTEQTKQSFLELWDAMDNEVRLEDDKEGATDIWKDTD